MDIHAWISLLVHTRACIPDTCTTIRAELQTQIDMLRKQL